MSVLLTGTFDGVHVGHMRLFRAALTERLAQSRLDGLLDRPVKIVIGVLSDKLVKRHKGAKPLFKQNERRRQVDQAMWAMGGRQYEVQVVGDEAEFFMSHPQSHIVVGSDWLDKPVLPHWGLTQDDLFSADLRIVVVPYTQGISTSDLKERARNA